MFNLGNIIFASIVGASLICLLLFKDMVVKIVERSNEGTKKFRETQQKESEALWMSLTDRISADPLNASLHQELLELARKYKWLAQPAYTKCLYLLANHHAESSLESLAINVGKVYYATLRPGALPSIEDELAIQQDIKRRIKEGVQS